MPKADFYHQDTKGTKNSAPFLGALMSWWFHTVFCIAGSSQPQHERRNGESTRRQKSCHRNEILITCSAGETRLSSVAVIRRVSALFRMQFRMQ
jgi:hypothetical protein